MRTLVTVQGARFSLRFCATVCVGCEFAVGGKVRAYWIRVRAYWIRVGPTGYE